MGTLYAKKCGKIIDVEIDEFDFKRFFETKIKNKLNENYRIRNYGVEFYGLCGGCDKDEFPSNT